MEFLIRFTQWHESFRVAEIEAVTTLLNIDLEILSYSDEVRV
jgi:tRNA (guanine10-N2)-methyltransferase